MCPHRYKSDSICTNSPCQLTTIMPSNWPITPSPSIGLLVLIALLHIVENLVQSTIRIIKMLAIALFIILRLKASSSSGSRYISRWLDIVLATTHSPAQTNTTTHRFIEPFVWLALAKRARDFAFCTFARVSESLAVDAVVESSKESNETTRDICIDKAPKADGTPSY
jgi:hypothetical protein